MATDEAIARDYVRLLLRISRAGARNGWTDELDAVWDHAADMSRAIGIPDATIQQIYMPGFSRTGSALA